jgi:sporulation integral membrane protein YlbJ
MLGAPEAGVYLIAAHYLSAVFTGIIFGISAKRKHKTIEREKFGDVWLRFKKDIALCRPAGDLLSESIEKSLTTLIKIGGFIIVFSVIMEILSISGVLDAAVWAYSPLARLTGLTEQSTKAMLIGGVEMTTGCSAASALQLSLVQKLPIVSSIIAFGGMCIHMQTKSVCAPSGLKLKHFILAKSIQAFFAYIICALSLVLFPVSEKTQANSIDIKTAAFYGIGFAAFSLIALLIIKYIQKAKFSVSGFTFGRKL